MWNHHGDDGCFAGLIDPDLIKDEIERAVPCTGRAGSMSFHHVRALHGSALNTSDRSRNLLLYEVAASDAWPLMGVKDFAEFNSRLLTGDPVVTPRMTSVPVRMPLPPAIRQRLWPFLEHRSAKRSARPTEQVMADLLRSNHSIVLNLEELRVRASLVSAESAAS